jgi:hypothetical protein
VVVRIFCLLLGPKTWEKMIAYPAHPKIFVLFGFRVGRLALRYISRHTDGCQRHKTTLFLSLSFPAA